MYTVVSVCQSPLRGWWLVERFVQEPRKKEQKIKLGRVEKGRGGYREELEELPKGIQLLVNIQLHANMTWICAAEGF